MMNIHSDPRQKVLYSSMTGGIARDYKIETSVRMASVGLEDAE